MTKKGLRCMMAGDSKNDDKKRLLDKGAAEKRRTERFFRDEWYRSVYNKEQN